ncbi:MAG: cyclic nucleotide-binding domain-containing protein [Burkholderiales bacterium]|nr:cyclic nucleotide-binding domain-containing protein [Anaerolineae bacterium]
MSQHDTVQFLAQVPLFHGLTERQLKKIVGRFRERSFDEGTAIVEQGKLGIGLFIIVEGEAEARRIHADGSSVLLNKLHRTDFFGELSLLDEAPRTASVIATTKTDCLVLMNLDFMEELHHEPDMAVEMLKALAGRFRRMMEHL